MEREALDALEAVTSAGKNGPQASINSLLTDDCLRAILCKLGSQIQKDKFSLVCKRWLAIQSSERRRISARAGPLMLLRLAARFPNLLELDFSQSLSRSFYPGVTDVDLQTIATNFRLLEFINLRGCPGISNPGLAALARGLPGLKHIDLSDCKRVSDNGIGALASSCTRLVAISFARCKLVTDLVLELLAASCKELRYLNISGCNSISDQGLQSLAAGCSRLESLDLSSCPKVGDSGLVSITSSNPGLSSINLSDCSSVSDKSVRSIATNCRGSIRDLRLAGCSRLTDDSIGALAAECGDVLESLELSRCGELSDEGVLAVFSRCRRLRSVLLEGCSRITDESLDALRINGDSLVNLSLAFCCNISDAGVWKIGASCRRLELVDLRMCNEVTPSGVSAADFPLGCKDLMATICSSSTGIFQRSSTSDKCSRSRRQVLAMSQGDPIREWILKQGGASTITRVSPVGGGCINTANRYDTDAGSFFVKTNRNIDSSMFEAEAAGLKAMFETNTIRVPNPLKVGNLPRGGSYIIMECINFGGSGAAGQRELGKKLAEMHKAGVSSKGFGFEVNNTIGRSLFSHPSHRSSTPGHKTGPLSFSNTASLPNWT